MTDKKSIFSKIADLFILLGIIALVVIGGKEKGETLPRQKVLQIDNRVLTLFPQASSVSPLDTSVIAVKDSDGILLGYLLQTSPYADHLSGFAGPTPLLIGLDRDEHVLGTVLLDNHETESYIRRITEEGFFNSWNGCSPAEALDKKVDALSGATLTTRAVMESFQIRMALYQKSPYSKKTQISRVIQDILALILIAWAVFAFFNPQKWKKSRFSLFALSLFILGFMQGRSLSLALFQSWILHGIPSWGHYVMILLVLISLLLPLLVGRHFYCAWLCPFGAWQELVGKVRKRKLKLPKLFYSIRKYYLILIVFLLLFGLVSDLAPFEPFAAFQLQLASASSLILAGLFTLLSLFIHRPWCRIGCPTGQLLEFVRSFSLKNKALKKNEE